MKYQAHIYMYITSSYFIPVQLKTVSVCTYNKLSNQWVSCHIGIFFYK